MYAELSKNKIMYTDIYSYLLCIFFVQINVKIDKNILKRTSSHCVLGLKYSIEVKGKSFVATSWV